MEQEKPQPQMPATPPAIAPANADNRPPAYNAPVPPYPGTPTPPTPGDRPPPFTGFVPPYPGTAAPPSAPGYPGTPPNVPPYPGAMPYPAPPAPYPPQAFMPMPVTPVEPNAAPNSNLAVETRALSKRYGNFMAVNNVSLQIERGAIFGFIGPNGAGKTTTMRILATLLQPTSGQAWVNGNSVNNLSRSNIEAIRRSVGYMPDYFGIYDRMKSWEYLDFFASAYYIEHAKRMRLIEDLLTLVDLTEKRETFIEDLSRGMKQRLGLARTLVHDPALLILDEPASGLDPRARVELRELLKELSRMGKTIIVSSHILTELAEMCTHIGIIERGVLLAQGRVSDILYGMRQQNRLVQVRLSLNASQAVEQVINTLAAGPNVRAVHFKEETRRAENEPRLLRLEVETSGDEAALHELLKYILAQNLVLFGFAEREDNLEDIFLKVTRGLVA